MSEQTQCCPTCGRCGQPQPVIIWQLPKPVFYVHRALKASFSSGGTELTFSESSLAVLIAAIKHSLQPITLDPEAAIGFTLTYVHIDDDDNDVEIKIGKSCYLPESDDEHTPKQIALRLIIEARKEFLKALARQQIPLRGVCGELEMENGGAA